MASFRYAEAKINRQRKKHNRDESMINREGDRSHPRDANINWRRE